HTDSDEFTSNTIANWASWDPGTFITTAIETADGEHHMRFSATGNGSIRFGGRYKSVPSNDFVFLAYCSNDGPVDNNAPVVGLLVGQDLAGAPTTSDFISV